MAADQEQEIATSTFPIPPPFYRLYGENNSGLLPPDPPAPLTGTFQVFEKQFNTVGSFNFTASFFVRKYLYNMCCSALCSSNSSDRGASPAMHTLHYVFHTGRATGDNVSQQHDPDTTGWEYRWV